MGLNFSTTYDKIVKSIEQNDIAGVKTIVNTIDREEVRQYCINTCPEDDLQRSLLHHAVWRDDSTLLQLLMPYCEGDSLEIYDAYGMTPLSAAINRGNFDAVKLLLEHSSQINCDQNDGYLLLRNAVYKNCSEIVHILVQYNCQTKNEQWDSERGSLIHVATDLGNIDIVRCLIEKCKLDVNIEDRWKITPIHVAAAKNRLDILKYLIDNGAKIDIEDIFGNTPLGWAVFCKSEDCTIYLRSINAKVKEFVVPPPPAENEGITEIDLGNNSKRDDMILTTKNEGAFNPSFSINDEKKTETTII